jgi:L-lactate dehydrogenase complex protein LldG
LAAAWQQDADGLPELVPYAEPVESFKERIFAVDAAVTAAAGAVADTGALILRPTAAEPRLMSLVPPAHIAVLAADAIHPSLSEAMRAGRWSEDMPTNLLLISGPSKTADIELILAFGVHGPKELIVLILE